jgi:membrane protein implicated in regulation of membrane protease activity
MKYLKVGMFVVLAVMVVMAGRGFAQDEEDSPYQNVSEVLTDLFNGAITVDESMEFLRQLYEQQQLLEQFQQNQTQVRAILTGIQNLNVQMTPDQIQQVADVLNNFVQGNIDINQAQQQLTQILGQPVQIEVPDTRHRKGTPLDEAKKKAAKKKQAEKKQPPVQDPVLHGKVQGVKEINGKMYLEIKAEGVDICDGNGMQKANGETWLVEVDQATAEQYKNKIGEDIYIAGDIQPDVDGKLTMKMNKNYGGGIVSADYYKQAWYKQNVDYMTRSYWDFIEQRYGDSLSYKEKLQLLQQMLYAHNEGLNSFVRR